MKTFLFLLCGLLAAGCSSPAGPVVKQPGTAQKPRVEIEHELISAKLKKELNNPASYQPVSFVPDGKWTKRDSIMLVGLTSATEMPGPYLKADSAKIAGARYQHRFRATNEAGGLVLMDKTVVVYPNDSVVVMNF